MTLDRQNWSDIKETRTRHWVIQVEEENDENEFIILDKVTDKLEAESLVNATKNKQYQTKHSKLLQEFQQIHYQIAQQNLFSKTSSVIQNSRA